MNFNSYIFLQGFLMTLTPEQISASNKANMETLNSLSKNAFAGLEKLLELNLQVVKTVLQEQLTHIQSTANVKDAQTLLIMQAQFLQPFAEKLSSYSQHLQNINYETQTAIMETANADIKDRSSKIQNLVTEISTSTPGNGDLMVTALKNAIANANQVYESSQKAIKQVIDISTQQTKTMTDAAIKVSEELSIIAKQKTL